MKNLMELWYGAKMFCWKILWNCDMKLQLPSTTSSPPPTPHRTTLTECSGSKCSVPDPSPIPSESSRSIRRRIRSRGSWRRPPWIRGTVSVCRRRLCLHRGGRVGVEPLRYPRRGRRETATAWRKEIWYLAQSSKKIFNFVLLKPLKSLNSSIRFRSQYKMFLDVLN